MPDGPDASTIGAPSGSIRGLLGRHLAVPVYLLLASVAVATWYAGAKLAWGDDATHPLSLSRAHTYFRLLDTGLGGPDGRKFPFLLPLGGLLQLWRLLHLPYDLTMIQPAIIVLLLSGGASSMYVLVRVLLPRVSRLGAFGGGLFYAFNIYAATTIWSSMAYLAIHYALLPLVVVAWVVALRRGTAFAAIAAGVAWAVALTPAYITTPVAVTDSALFAGVGLTLVAAQGGRRIRTTVAGAGIYGVWLCISLFWIIPLATTTAAVTASGLAVADPAQLLSENSAPLLGALRLGGYWGITSTYLEHPYFAWADYYNRIGLNAAAAIPIAAAVGVVAYLTRSGRARLLGSANERTSWLALRFAFVLALVALFLITGTHAPLGGLKKSVVVGLGLEGPFRSVYQRFGVYLALAYGPLVAAGISALQVAGARLVRRRELGYVAALAAIVVIAVVPAWPMWTGTIMDSSGFAPARRVTVPQDYFRIASIVNDTPGDFDVLALPFGGFGPITLHWGLTNTGFYDRSVSRGYNGIEPLQLLTDKGLATKDGTAPYTFDWAQTVVTGKAGVRDALRLLNARYIVLHLDENTRYLSGSGRWTGTAIRKVAGRLDRRKDVELVYASGTLRVYAVPGWRPFRVFALTKTRAARRSPNLVRGRIRPVRYEQDGLSRFVVHTGALQRGDVVVVNRPFDARWRANGRAPVEIAPGLVGFVVHGEERMSISYGPERRVRLSLLILPVSLGVFGLALVALALRKRRAA